MVDIADAAQKSQDSPLLKEEAVLPPPAPPPASPLSPEPPDDIMNAVLDASSQEGQKTIETIQPPADSDSSTPPAKKHRSSRTGIVVAVILLLLFAIPLSVYFVSQQQQLAELRGRAAGPYPSGYNCSRNTDCLSGYCDGPSGVCKPQNPAYLLPNGENCVLDKNCASGYCDGPKGVCWPKPNATITTPSGPSTPTSIPPPGGPTPTPDYTNYDYITFTCSSCGADRRCQTEIGTNPSFSFGNSPGACSQVDRRRKGDTGNWEAVSLCDPSCSGGGTTPTPGGGGSPTPPGGGHTPMPTTPSGGQCETIRVYDATGTEITSALRNGTRTLSVGETVTLATPKSSATKARFRIQGITQFAENNPSLTTSGEYRLSVQIPSTITQAQASFEVEVFISGNWK